MTTLTGWKIHAYRLASLKMQLKMEAAGMTSSGGAIRPRIAAEFGLKPRASHAEFIEAVEKRIAELVAANTEVK